MGILYDWIKNIVIYMILNTIIMNLLGNSSYKKYISIVSGMILVLIVISPFMKYLKMEENLDYYLKSNEFAVETSEFKNNLLLMEEQQIDKVFKEYTNRIRSQVETILKGEKLTLTDFHVSYDKDTKSVSFGEITGIQMAAVYKNNEAEKNNRIEIDRIEIETVSKEDGKTGETPVNPPSPTEINIKIKLSDFYNIEPDNININIQGG